MEADPLRARLGPARLSHPDEFADILRQLEAAGFKVEYREGSIAYSPETNGPGKLIIDRDLSIGALRHEFRHALDLRDAGYPSFGRYLGDPREFAKYEVLGYLEELKAAKEFECFDAVPEILRLMKRRVAVILGMQFDA